MSFLRKTQGCVCSKLPTKMADLHHVGTIYSAPQSVRSHSPVARISWFDYHLPIVVLGAVVCLHRLAFSLTLEKGERQTKTINMLDNS